jgi:hypothetical protein
VGATTRSAVVVGALSLPGVLAACGVTEGLILGEAPLADAGQADAGQVESASMSLDAEPLLLTLSGQSLTDQHGGDGGTAYTDLCPLGQAVIGYQGFLTAPSVGLILVGGIQALCGELVLTGPTITTTAGATLTIRGESQASPWTQTCPANEVVVGFVGRSGDDLDQVAFQCAAWTVSGDAGSALSSGSIVTLAPAGGDGGTPYEDGCPSGQVARGSNLRAGEWVDAFGLVCGTLGLGPADGGP